MLLLWLPLLFKKRGGAFDVSVPVDLPYCNGRVAHLRRALLQAEILVTGGAKFSMDCGGARRYERLLTSATVAGSCASRGWPSTSDGTFIKIIIV